MYVNDWGHKGNVELLIIFGFVKWVGLYLVYWCWKKRRAHEVYDLVKCELTEFNLQC